MGPEPKPGVFEGSAEVTAMAKKADVVVLCLGFSQGGDTNSAHTALPGRWPPEWARKKGLVEAEDSDRPFELPLAEIETAKLVTAANPNTVLVLEAGAAFDVTPFIDKVQAALWAFYPGQDGGVAVADALFGEVTPGGKLPFTFAKRYADYPSAPYYNLNQSGKTPYTEGLFVGYRGFDAKSTAPLYPFGFGLSYTRFDYADLKVAGNADGSASVSVTVKNSGARNGDEVVQVYIAPPKEAVPRPPKELAGYARVSLSHGESKTVSIALEPRAFSYWDEQAAPGGAWKVEAGRYEVRVGGSSADARVKGTLDVPARVISP
jgi:beta-glucosidase